MGVESKKLFEVPIGTNGKVVCTQPADKVYVLEFTSPPDNRLTSEFCKAVLLALDIVELRYPHGVLITTSGITKFYSNGLDLEHASWTPGFFTDSLYALWRRLLVYPMPTIALMNGHAFAGALMLAMMHDYRIMNPHRGFVCLNEVELGVPLRPPMSSIFRSKVSPQVYRTLVLEGKRFKALDALKEGIVDAVGGFDETMSYIEEMKLVSRAEKGVYGALKREMFRETVQYLENWGDESKRDLEADLARTRELTERETRVKAFEIKSKL